MARHAAGSTSRLTSILCAILLFSANVLAASAVLGIDLGTEYIKASLVKPGIPLEIVLTKDSRRKEVAAVAFKPPRNGPTAGTYPERVYGSDAMALAARFPGDVYPNLKSILGLPAGSATVKEYAARHPALQLETHSVRQTASFRSKDAFTPEEDGWMVEELLAMELQSIQKNAEALAGSGTTVRSVVLTVPPFYTVEEKRAVEIAADLAGLKVLSLMSDGLAVGLNYATSRQFPNINEGGKPEHHMVFDMGAGSTKATILKMQSRTVKDIGKFNKTIQEVMVLGSGWDRTLGGDALNSIIVDDMVEKFIESSAAKVSADAGGVRSHGRAIAKLSKEAERLRHVLSANTNTQASFEGLYEDIDFKYKITRAEFEALSNNDAEKVATVIQDALKMAGMNVEDLTSVILHGGASRTPFVQKQLEKILGGSEKLRSNVNADEAAVFGAGFRAAELSPSFRVKEIRIFEGAAYPAGMKYNNDKGKMQHQRLWTETSHLGAAVKEVTFTNKEDFSIEFYQQVLASGDHVTTGVEERPTKTLLTKNLTATVAMMAEQYSCEPIAVSFKVGMRLSNENGEVEVTKAYVECEAEVVEKESFVDGVKNMFGFGNKKDQQPLQDESEMLSVSGSSSSSSSSSSATEYSTSDSAQSSTSSPVAASGAPSPSGKTKKMVSIPVQYEMEKIGTMGLDKVVITSLKDRLKAFEASDRSRRLREETLNQLEGFTYKIRDLLDSDVFQSASTAEERALLEEKGAAASDWLYGDGADASREELKSRLNELQDIVVPIQTRIKEGSERPELIKSLKGALNQTITFVNSIKVQIAEADAWTSSQTPNPSSDSASTPSITAAPSNDDFDGLEDESSSTTTTKSLNMDDLRKERGPVPPLYTLDDLKESEELYNSISSWLEEKEAEQDKLPPTANPVLSVKELTDKREKLDKVGMDLAMKGVKNYERKQKQEKSSAKSSKTKQGKGTKSSKAAGADPTVKLKVGEDGKVPSEEEIEEMIRKFQEEAAARDTKEDKPDHDEL